jgi:hypothetical protein
MLRTCLTVAAVAAGVATAQDRTAVLRLDPEAFAAEVKKDERAAASKFKGRAIELSGQVAGVHRNIRGDVYLSLPSKSAGILGVACFLKDPNIYGKVVKGQAVTVRGRYPDVRVGVQILDCEVVKVGPSPALTYTSEQMAREWTMDRKAATQKWKDKVVIVSGEVAGTKANDVGAVTVYLKGTDTARIDCGFTAFEKDLAGKIKPGEQVKIVGEFLDVESKPAGPGLRFCQIVKD